MTAPKKNGVLHVAIAGKPTARDDPDHASQDLSATAAFELRRKGGDMLYYALLFLIIALVAGVLGFGGVAFAAAGIAKILFFIFIVMFVVSLVAHLMRRRPSGT
jgi:uncharacterized membrane protein YtjA (UPF0391 family)